MKRLPIFLFFLFTFVGVIPAETLESVALKILDKAPATSEDLYELKRADASMGVVANLPDPEVGGEYLFAPESDDNRWAVEATWGVEWPGVYGARKKEAKGQVDVTQKAVNVRRIERLAEIKGLLLEYIACRQKLAILNELNQNNDSIYHLAEQSHRGGEMTVLDLNKVRLEYANIKVAKVALHDEESDVMQQLSVIYGEDCAGLLSGLDCEFPEIVYPTGQQMEDIRNNAPAVMQAMAEEETTARGIRVAKMEGLPSLSLGYKHAYEEMTHFNGAILGVSIPIFSNRGKKHKAEVDYMDSQFRTAKVAAETMTEAELNLKRLRVLDEQIKELAPIVENADYNSTLLKAYKGGVITLIEYLTDRNYFATAALELVNLRLTAARLGTTLSKFL